MVKNSNSRLFLKHNMQKLLLLHGALGCKNDFDAIQKLLSTHYDCYTLDFIGHGSEAASEIPLSIASLAYQTKVFVELNQLQNAFVFGYSMGGYVASYLHKQTGYFSKIYTLGTKFIWHLESAQKEAGLLNPATIAEKVPDYAAKLINRHGANHWGGLLQKTATMMQELSQHPALSLSDFKAISCATAIGLGDQDKMIPLEDAIAIKNAHPNACLDILPFTQHPIDRVTTELLVQRLNYFFNL